MHARALVLQIVAQVLSQGLDGSLGSVVCCVSWRVSNTLLTASDDNTRWLRLGGLLNDGEEGVYAVDNTEEIGLQGLVLLV